jgi:hypothetical protein
MLPVTQAEQTNERRQLQSEIALWRCEVRYLHEEYRKAVADLHRLEGALRRRVQALDAYAAALDDHEQRLAAEEWAEPAEGEGGPAEGLPPESRVGSHQILKHWRRREDHERVRSQHYAVLAYWSLMLQTVSEPGEGAHPLAGPKVPARFHG